MIVTFMRDNWEVLAGFLGTVFAFFGGRKSKVLNDKTMELDNIKKVREIEKSLLTDMQDQINKLIKYNDYLEGVVKDVKQKLVKYSDKYGEITD